MRKTQSSRGNVFTRIFGLQTLSGFLSFHLKIYLICIAVLSTCKYVHHWVVWCPQRPDKGIGYLGNEITKEVMSCYVGAWN